MKKSFPLLSVLLLSLALNAQVKPKTKENPPPPPPPPPVLVADQTTDEISNNEIKQTKQGDEIYTLVEEQAEFPGGGAEMIKYLQTNIKYPQTAKDRGASGTCFLKIIVKASGKIESVQILKGVPACPECDREALRVVNSMPDWKPARTSGKNVNCYYHLPIKFKL